jgi:hypothetical protein
MLKRAVSILACGGTLLFMDAGAIASSVPQKDAEEAVTSFFQAIVSPGHSFSYWEFEGEARERMKLLLSKRLLANLDNMHDCFRDWARHQPPNSTDKPPGVDCCVFTASADWFPTSFALQKSELMPDGRRRVTVEYRFDSRDGARPMACRCVHREGGATLRRRRLREWFG